MFLARTTFCIGMISRSAAAEPASAASDDAAPDAWLAPSAGLYVGVPLKASVTIGLGFGFDSHHLTVPEERGLFVEIEPGLGGARAAVGFRTLATAGLAVKASVLRTWSHPWGAEPASTYVGPELEGNWVMYSARVGVFFPTAGAADRPLGAVSIGIGF